MKKTITKKAKAHPKWLAGWVTRLDKEMDDVKVEPELYAKKQKVRPAKRKR